MLILPSVGTPVRFPAPQTTNVYRNLPEAASKVVLRTSKTRESTCVVCIAYLASSRIWLFDVSCAPVRLVAIHLIFDLRLEQRSQEWLPAILLVVASSPSRPRRLFLVHSGDVSAQVCEHLISMSPKRISWAALPAVVV